MLMMVLTTLAAGGSSPASTSKTVQLDTSDSLLASTDPEDPAPTTMKSNESPSENEKTYVKNI